MKLDCPLEKSNSKFWFGEGNLIMSPKQRSAQASDILQSALTIAGIILGLLSYITTTRHSLALIIIMFLAGATALFSSVQALVELKAGTSASWKTFLNPSYSEGVLLWSIILLSFAYLLIVFPDTSDNFAKVLNALAELFKTNNPK